jgi:hypothetical protein
MGASGPVVPASSWATATELQTYLQAARLVAVPPDAYQALLDFTGALAAAKDRFEQATGYVPFEAAAVDSTRKYDPQQSCLVDLDTGLVSLTSVTYGGNVQVLDTDFFLWPENNPAQGKPYRGLEFLGPVYGLPRSIVVVGTFGFCANGALPDGAKQAQLAGAASWLSPQIEGNLSKGVMRWQEGDVSKEFGKDPLGTLKATWEMIFCTAAGSTYKLLRMG